jgi:ATP-dependent Clp protease adaptor protein ClpS|nr:ATP-dependent Clp protease adapter ClpS [Oxynema sp. CENA135]
MGTQRTENPRAFKPRSVNEVIATVFPVSAIAPTVTPDRTAQVTRKPYPNYRVIVLDDDFNTFEHVATCLMKYIPGMTGDLAWKLTNQVHFEGQATVWVGPLEQAELYHQQLSRAGLTMAPLEQA